MSLKNSVRLYKHYMGNLKADGFSEKPVQRVEADRVASRTSKFYNVDGSPKSQQEVKEGGPGFDVTKEDKPEPKKDKK